VFLSRERIVDSPHDAVNPHASRPGVKTIALVVLALVAVLTAHNWTDLKVLFGIQ